MNIRPITWEDLILLPREEQESYIEEVRDAFVPTYTELSNALKVDCEKLILYFMNNGFPMSNSLGRRIPPPQSPSRLEKWVRGEINL